MKNVEMIQNYNNLDAMQKIEKEYYKENKKQLFAGRIQIMYAMRKNMAEFLNKLAPYFAALEELDNEYRDKEKEQAVFEEAMNQYEKKKRKSMIEGTDPGTEPIPQEVFRTGKSEDEYGEKKKELLEIDVRDVNIHKIKVECMDGLELSSEYLGAFMFMLEE